MPSTASLSTKLIRIGASLLVVALASIGLTLWVTWQLEGGAAAVNEAGRMRMQTWRLSSAVQADVPARDIETLVGQFDGSLRLLREGDASRPLFVPWDDTVRTRFATVEQDWNAFRSQWAGPTPIDTAALRAQAAAFVDHIDALVNAIEAHMSRWTALQHLLQTAVLMLAVTGGATLLLTGYRFVLEPVSQLKRAIERLQAGDFSARVSGRSTDGWAAAMRSISPSGRYRFIRNPTVPAFMPNTGLPVWRQRCRVCSMKPSPPSATMTSACSGVAVP